jgi:F-type H+-transporting ATPase subunit b
MGELGINLGALLAFLISFVILLVLLSVVLYKPVTKMLDERAAKIKESMEQVEHIKKESARAEETVKAQIETGRKEGQAIVAQASQIGEKVKEEARAEARQQAESLIAKARLEIERERQEGFDQLRQEFVDLAILAAEKVINQSLDKKAHQRLIEEVLEEGTGTKKE